MSNEQKTQEVVIKIPTISFPKAKESQYPDLKSLAPVPSGTLFTSQPTPVVQVIRQQLPPKEVRTCPYVLKRGPNKGNTCGTNAKSVFIGAQGLWYCNNAHAKSSLNQDDGGSNGDASQQQPEEKQRVPMCIPMPALRGAPPEKEQENEDQPTADEMDGPEPEELELEEQTIMKINHLYSTYPYMLKLVPKQSIVNYESPQEFLEFLRLTEAKRRKANLSSYFLRASAYSVETFVTSKTPINLTGFAAALDTEAANELVAACIDDGTFGELLKDCSPAVQLMATIGSTALLVFLANKAKGEPSGRGGDNIPGILNVPGRDTERFQNVLEKLPGFPKKEKAIPESVLKPPFSS